jgi:hypothetical protein
MLVKCRWNIGDGGGVAGDVGEMSVRGARQLVSGMFVECE